jgi:hypothetical protein
MVMGDTVVFQDEVSPAMDAAFAGSLEVTALPTRTWGAHSIRSHSSSSSRSY